MAEKNKPVITIVSAPINSGKSSFIREYFKSFTNADGFVCRKVFENNLHIGYDLQHLTTLDSVAFIRKKESLPPDWRQAAETGRFYSFSIEGFCFAESIAANALENDVTCFFIDEAGPLELAGKGFAGILTRLLASGIDLVIVVREHLVADVIQCFSLKNFRVISPDRKYLSAD